MGISRNPWMSGSRKTAADLTWLELKGQQVFRRKRAPGQSNPSNAFLQAQSVAHQFWPIFRGWSSRVREGWTLMPTKQSADNAFYKASYNSAFNLSSPPTATLIPGNLRPSHGVMTPTPLSATPVVTAGAQTVSLAWNTTPADPTQLSTDVLRCVLYNETTGRAFITNAGALRSAGSITPTFPPGLVTAGDVIDVFTFFIADPLASNHGTSSDNTQATVTAV